MKKNFISMVLVLSLIFGMLVPKRSEAIVGAAIAVPAVVTVGAITGGTGFATVLGTMIYGTTCSGRGCALDGIVLFLMGAAVLIVGLVILDDNSHGMEFTALNETKAEALGITAEQAAAYNSELDEINAAKQTVQMEVVKMEKPSVDEAHALWQEMRGNISPEAYGALEKVSAEFVKSLK